MECSCKIRGKKVCFVTKSEPQCQAKVTGVCFCFSYLSDFYAKPERLLEEENHLATGGFHYSFDFKIRVKVKMYTEKRNVPFQFTNV